MVRTGSRTAVLAGLLAVVGLVAASHRPVAGTSRDAPLAEDTCPESNPEFDLADPTRTLYAPEPSPGHDLCAMWVTTEWDDYGPDAQLRYVTFGLRALGDVELRPDRSYSFGWSVPTSYDHELPVPGDDGYCGTTIWVTDGTAHPTVSYRACGAPTVDHLVGGRVTAQVSADGPVLEVRIRVPSAPAALAASLVSGGTLWSFGATSYLAEPWADDSIGAGDLVFEPPEDPDAEA